MPLVVKIKGHISHASHLEERISHRQNEEYKKKKKRCDGSQLVEMPVNAVVNFSVMKS